MVFDKLEKLGYIEIRGAINHGDYTISGFFKVTELGKQYIEFQKL